MKFRHPCSCLVVGPSQSGKTFLIRKLLKHRMYEPNIKRVRWCYTYSAPWFLKEPEIEFIQGLPDPETYESGDLLILDDMMHHLDIKIADLFTATSHHKNVSVILILQNMFPRSRVMRDISLNAHYIFVFKNVRDKSQINCLARQLFPGQTYFFMAAYKQATRRPFGYLLLDLHPRTPDCLRVRENIFPDERGLYWLYRPLYQQG